MASTEYPLPIIPDQHITLPDWLRAFGGLTLEQVLGALAEQWAGIQSPALRRLRARLLAGVPSALVLCNGHYRLRLRRVRQGPAYKWWNSTDYCLGPSLKPGLVQRELASLGMVAESSLVEFLCHFDGLSDWDCCGGFDRLANWCDFGSTHHLFTGKRLPDPSLPDIWREAAMLYGAANGNVLLLAKGMRTAWYHHDEDRIEPFAETFEGLLKGYVENSDCFYPFDGYGSQAPRDLFDDEGVGQTITRRWS